MKRVMFYLLIFVLFLTCSNNRKSKDEQISNRSDLLKGNLNWPIYRGDSRLTGRAGGYISDEPELLWKFKTEKKIMASVIVQSNIVYIGSYDGYFYALDLNSGQEIWKQMLDSPIEAGALYQDRKIIISSLDGIVYTFNALSGELIWQKKLPDNIMSSANFFLLRKKLPVVIIGCYDSILYCLDLKNGKIIWTYETGNFINGTPAVANEIIVFGGCDASLHILSANTGKKINMYKVGSYIAASTAIYNNLAFVGHYEGELICVDYMKNKLVWKYGDKEDGAPFFSSAAVGSNIVVVGSRDRNVHAIDRETGKKKWIFKTRGNVDSSPVICKDKVIACSEDGFIYLIDIEKGIRVWSYEVGAKIIGSPAVVQNKIIFGALNGIVYCFGDKL